VPAPAPYALRVDFLAREALPTKGRLGLTRAPGRLEPGRSLDPDVRLREDLETLARAHGASRLVTLLQPQELSKLGRIDLAARRAGLRWRHFPIPDFNPPSSLAKTGRLVGDLLRALRGGETVVVHCWGGLGRTGTVAACLLVAAGASPAEALGHVRAARPGAVEVASQEAFVDEFAAWSRERP